MYPPIPIGLRVGRNASTIVLAIASRTLSGGNLYATVVEAVDVVQVVHAGVDRLNIRELGVDVVKVPCHGARHTVTDAFLDGDGAKAVSEAVADGRAHAGGRGDPCNQDRVDTAGT